MSSESMPRAPKEVASFYDAFGAKLLKDFVYGNMRVEAAIERVSSSISEDMRRILDVGCGIGATSDRYLSENPGTQVDGVDISPNNIDIALRLFGRDGLSFDVTEMEVPPSDAKYDLIALVDVYEHFPREKWSDFNEVLSQCLSDEGTLVMTTPSPAHQNYLATHKPEALQVVDETVDLADIVELARCLDAEITTFEYVNIWRTNDYIHAVLCRRLPYEPIRRPDTVKTGIRHRFAEKIRRRILSSPVRDVKARRKLVKNRLGIDI